MKWTILAAALLLAACAGESPAPRPGTYVVLLESLDGPPGELIFDNAGGRVSLTQPGQAVGAGSLATRPTSPFGVGEEDLIGIFGPAFAAAPPPPVSFQLNFDLSSTDLTEESKLQLPNILQIVQQRPAPEVVIVGHTDASGTPEDNYELGLKRAAMVRDVFLRIGVAPELIEVASYGAANPLYPSASGTPDPRNRRVEVIVR